MKLTTGFGILSALKRRLRDCADEITWRVRKVCEESEERRFPIKAILWSAFLLPVLLGTGHIVGLHPLIILLALVLGFSLGWISDRIPSRRR